MDLEMRIIYRPSNLCFKVQNISGNLPIVSALSCLHFDDVPVAAISQLAARR